MIRCLAFTAALAFAGAASTGIGSAGSAAGWHAARPNAAIIGIILLIMDIVL